MKQRRQHRKVSRGTTALGVAWYEPDQWLRVKELSTDPDRFEETFAEWEAMATKTLKQLVASGIEAEKVLIDADEFLAWCRSNEAQPDSGSRARFVAEKVRARHRRV